MTLLNGEQAEAAIKSFHQSCLRERELSVQLQPTDALLCVANLPPSLTQQQFEELVRPFGSLERCFLVYSERTGHSKGYGFAEYMKKDSAARAKSDLLGKPLGTRTLYVHWTDAGQLTPALLHSRCLCVDRLPPSFSDVEALRRALSAVHTPTFCQVSCAWSGSWGVDAKPGAPGRGVFGVTIPPPNLLCPFSVVLMTPHSVGFLLGHMVRWVTAQMGVRLSGFKPLHSL